MIPATDLGGPVDQPPAIPVFVEVTNTLALPYVTGFQRHTRELLARLPGAGTAGPVVFVPICWCHECGTFRRLTDAEAVRLRVAPTPSEVPRSRLATAGDRLPPVVARAARRLVRTRSVSRVREALARARRRRAHPAEHEMLRIDPWPSPSFLFDLEAAWHDPAKRPELLPRLIDRGVVPTALIADVMPELFPEWFEAGATTVFIDFLRAHLRHSRHLVCISECTRRDTIALAERLGLGPPSTSLTTMGADFASTEGSMLPEGLAGLRFVICVATVEPRKNHSLLLDAFDALRHDVPDLALVLVGKVGWKTDAVIERIRSHPEYGSRLRWFDRLDDAALESLYAHARCAVMPSFYEGFGTPVIEALARGVPTLSSNGGALMEAGGRFAEYFDPRSTDELVALLRRHLTDETFHEHARRELAAYRPPTWADGAAMILETFEGLAAAYRD